MNNDPLLLDSDGTISPREAEKLAELLYSEYCAVTGMTGIDGTALMSWIQFSSQPEHVKSATGWRTIAANQLVRQQASMTKAAELMEICRVIHSIRRHWPYSGEDDTAKGRNESVVLGWADRQATRFGYANWEDALSKLEAFQQRRRLEITATIKPVPPQEALPVQPEPRA